MATSWALVGNPSGSGGSPVIAGGVMAPSQETFSGLRHGSDTVPCQRFPSDLSVERWDLLQGTSGEPPFKHLSEPSAETAVMEKWALVE